MRERGLVQIGAEWKGMCKNFLPKSLQGRCDKGAHSRGKNDVGMLLGPGG